MTQEKKIYEAEATPELTRFFNKLHELKKFVWHMREAYDMPVIDDIYDKFDSIFKSEDIE